LREYSKDFVTVKVHLVSFVKLVLHKIVELRARIIAKGNVRVEVKVHGFTFANNTKELAINGVFTLVAVSKTMRPIRL